jgi:hypothetical protein
MKFACAPVLALLAATLPGQDPGDLVVFVADGQPVLFRLVDDRAVPFGNARFHQPSSLVADPRRGLIHVLDRPPPGSAKQSRLWRIGRDGRGTVVAQAEFGSLDQNLGLDHEGRVLVAAGPAGLLRLETDGSFTPLVRAERGELKYLSCATAAADVGLHAASKHVVSHRGTFAQGALFHLDDQRVPAAARTLLTNVEPGRPAHETLWRSPTQLLVDPSGRVLLVDQGDPRSELLGGVLRIDAEGRSWQDLTFATPDRKAGLLRHPTGIAPFGGDAWLIADPAMYPGPGPSGGLFVLEADGRRDRFWRFGPRCRPLGVGVLHGAGSVPVPPARAFAAFVGEHAGGPARVVAAHGNRVEVTGMTVAGEFIPTGHREIPLGPDEAAAELARLASGCRWIIGPAGTLVFAAGGADPQEDGPRVCRGQIDLFHHALTFATGSRGRTRTDPDQAYVRGALMPATDGGLEAHVFFTRAGGEGLLEGEFVQPVGAALRAGPARSPGDPGGRYTAGEPEQFGFVRWTREELSGQPGSPSYGLYTERRPIARATAIDGLRAMLRGAVWEIADDGRVEVQAPVGRIHGNLARVGDELVLSLQAQVEGDLWCMLSGRIERRSERALIAWLALDRSRNREQTRAEFCQLLQRD